MSEFARKIHPHVARELAKASETEARGDSQGAFRHLERAHVLGQSSTTEHVRVHWAMLRWGARQGSIGEVFGQALRIIGAATKTVFGFVPSGNTGGANVSPLRSLPVPPDLQAIIEEARGEQVQPT